MNPYIKQANQQFVPVYIVIPLYGIMAKVCTFMIQRENGIWISGLESVCVLWDITIQITHVHCKNRWRSCYTPLIFFIMFLQLKLQSCSIRHLAWNRCFSQILERKQSKVQLKLLRNIIF